MTSRQGVNAAVHEAFSNYSNILSIYGSFTTNAFHHDAITNSTFSDVDLYSIRTTTAFERKQIAKNIRLHVKIATGVDMRISVRSRRIHDQTLSQVESWTVDRFETAYKLLLNPSQAHASYQIARFVLRTICSNKYFDNNLTASLIEGCGVNHALAKMLYEIKRGEAVCNDSEKILKEIADITNRYEPIYSFASLLSNLQTIRATVMGCVQDAKRQLNNESRALLDILEKVQRCT